MRDFVLCVLRMKTQLTKIENALPHREDTNIEIFGMEGIPEDVTRAHVTLR